MISQAKIEKGVNNIYKDAYKNKAEEENSKKDESNSNLNTSPNDNNKNKTNANPTIVQQQGSKNNTVVSKEFNKDGKVTQDQEACKNCRLF